MHTSGSVVVAAMFPKSYGVILSPKNGGMVLFIKVGTLLSYEEDEVL